MRTIPRPVATCLKTLNSASNNELALLTGMLNASQSPAGEMFLVETLFSVNHVLTAFRVAGVGLTNASVCARKAGVWESA